jgi:hypothetical protein
MSTNGYQTRRERMPWRKKKGRSKAAEKAVPPAGQAPAPAPRSYTLSDGTRVEVSAAMGTVYTIAADPTPGGLDVKADAPGWERCQAFLARLRGGR